MGPLGGLLAVQGFSQLACQKSTYEPADPQVGTVAGRAAAIKKAMEEIARQDADQAEADAADRARQEA